MLGKIIKDWTKLDIDNPEDVKSIKGALMHFMMAPERGKLAVREKVNAMVQEMTLATDFPESKLTQTIKQFQASPFYDTGYEELFDTVNFSQGNGFDIEDIDDGLTFNLVVPGHKINVYAMSGERQRIYFQYYGGGLGWHKDAFTDSNFWSLEKKAKTFRNRAYATRAAAFYALIEQLPVGRNIGWAAATPAALAVNDPVYNAVRDANTMDAAALDIFTRCQNKGYDLNPQTTTFVILAPLQLWNRLRQALSALLQAFAGSEKHHSFNFKLVITNMLQTQNVYYVGLPGEKLVAGYRMDLTMYDDFDILSLMNTTAGWMRYGGAIADTEQLCRCAII